MSEVLMATRDASWYNRPNVRSVKVYHVAIEDDFPPLMGCPQPYHAACSGAPLDENSIVAVEGAHFGLRCRRRGCMNVWAVSDTKENPPVLDDPTTVDWSTRPLTRLEDL